MLKKMSLNLQSANIVDKTNMLITSITSCQSNLPSIINITIEQNGGIINIFTKIYWKQFHVIFKSWNLQKKMRLYISINVAKLNTR